MDSLSGFEHKYNYCLAVETRIPISPITASDGKTYGFPGRDVLPYLAVIGDIGIHISEQRLC